MKSMSKGQVVKLVKDKIDPETAERIIDLMAQYLAAEDTAVKERDEVNQRVKAVKADFREKVEMGHGNQPIEIENKLTAVEMGWQDWEEAKSERTEINKHHKNKISELKKQIREEIENSRQGKLFDQKQ